MSQLLVQDQQWFAGAALDDQEVGPVDAQGFFMPFLRVFRHVVQFSPPVRLRPRASASSAPDRVFVPIAFYSPAWETVGRLNCTGPCPSDLSGGSAVKNQGPAGELAECQPARALSRDGASRKLWNDLDDCGRQRPPVDRGRRVSLRWDSANISTGGLSRLEARLLL